MELERVLGLEAQLLVGAAVLVALLDELLAHGWPPAGAGFASSMRSSIHELREARVEDAARVAGAGVEVVGDRHRRDRGEVRRRVPAVKSCVMPENEMPAMPTLPPLTHSCAATVSTAS